MIKCLPNSMSATVLGTILKRKKNDVISDGKSHLFLEVVKIKWFQTRTFKMIWQILLKQQNHLEDKGTFVFRKHEQTNKSKKFVTELK